MRIKMKPNLIFTIKTLQLTSKQLQNLSKLVIHLDQTLPDLSLKINCLIFGIFFIQLYFIIEYLKYLSDTTQFIYL